MKRIPILILLLALSGCSNFGTKQVEKRVVERYSETTGKLLEREKTDIITEAKSKAFVDGKSKVHNWKAKQTESTQSAEVGALAQDTTSTNAVDALKTIDSILGKVR